jgi:hypothetical protein
MSHSFNKKINKKPYCKVCHDAGKPESVYTSHFVKSLPNQNNGTTITCPTLNAITCRTCYKLGHTTKFCPVNQKSAKYGKATESVVIKKIEIVDRKVTNVFDVLSDDDDTDDEQEPATPIKIPNVTPISFIKENKKWVDIIKDNKPWTEYSDSDSDDDNDRYCFKPIHSVSITKKNMPKPMVSFEDDYW